MQSITKVKEHIIGLSHSGTLNKLRNIEALIERVGNTILSKIDPIETIRTQPVSTAVHDEVDSYPIPTDYKKLIDLYPQSERTSWDSATRTGAEDYSTMRSIKNRIVSIEGKNGLKFMNINWKSTPEKTVHDMNSLTSDGTWSVVGTATNLLIDPLYKVSGSNSVRFDLVTTGDGIQNTGLSSIDISDWDEQAEFFAWVYLPSTANLTSISAIWGNDLTTNYWTSTAVTTQQDGSAFKTGWNLVKFRWDSATESGTVDPNTIDSFKITFAITGAIADIRVDEITVSLGKLYDIKYYSQYFLQNTAGTWIDRTSSDEDVVVFEGTAYNIFLFELLKAIAQQVEGEDSQFDINYALRELNGDPDSSDSSQRIGLYARYRAEYPTQAKKQTGSYGTPPRIWGYTRGARGGNTSF
jgi:hypothetical protein